MLLKHANKIVLCSCCLLMLMPFSVSAEDSQENKEGQLDWKLDRVIEGDSKNEQSQTETELEKSFPELFEAETDSMIDSVKEENQESLDKLETELFAMDTGQNTIINDTKQSLFASDYVAPAAPADSIQEDESESSWFTNVLVTGLAGFACVVLGGVYFMLRGLSE